MTFSELFPSYVTPLFMIYLWKSFVRKVCCRGNKVGQFRNSQTSVQTSVKSNRVICSWQTRVVESHLSHSQNENGLLLISRLSLKIYLHPALDNGSLSSQLSSQQTLRWWRVTTFRNCKSTRLSSLNMAASRTHCSCLNPLHLETSSSILPKP